MWNKIPYYIVICLMVLVSNKQAISQQINGKTVYKEFRDSISLGNNHEVKIAAKKGHIVVTRWDKNMIWVWVRITFTNSDLSIARNELEYARYNFTKTTTGVNLNNYFSLPSGNAKISSFIKIDYHLKVPDGVILIINNEYGSCTVKDLNALVIINNKYGEIYLEKLRGKSRIYSTLCDIQANDISGSSEFYASNSTISLKNINGITTIQNKVGTLYISPGIKLENLNANCSYTDINLFIKDTYNYNYNLQAKNATIEVQERFRDFPFTKKSKNILEYHSKPTNGSIEIESSYKSIKLN